MLSLQKVEQVRFEQLAALEFVEVHGLLIRQDDHGDIEGTVRGWLDGKNTPVEVEAVLNHVHIWDEFPNRSETECELIAQAIEERWRESVSAMKLDYRIELSNTPDDYGPTITVFRRS